MICLSLAVLFKSLGANSLELPVYLDHVLGQFWQAHGRSYFVGNVERVSENVEMIVIISIFRDLFLSIAGAT